MPFGVSNAPALFQEPMTEIYTLKPWVLFSYLCYLSMFYTLPKECSICVYPLGLVHGETHSTPTSALWHRHKV